MATPNKTTLKPEEVKKIMDFVHAMGISGFVMYYDMKDGEKSAIGGIMSNADGVLVAYGITKATEKVGKQIATVAVSVAGQNYPGRGKDMFFPKNQN